jgi:hypothetical protein
MQAVACDLPDDRGHDRLYGTRSNDTNHADTDIFPLSAADPRAELYVWAFVDESRPYLSGYNWEHKRDRSFWLRVDGQQWRELAHRHLRRQRDRRRDGALGG